MRSQNIVGGCLLVLFSSVVADVRPNMVLWGPQGPPVTLEARQASATSSAAATTSTRVADSVCKNTALTRQCWDSQFSAATDFDAKWPTTGVTRYYSLEITNGTCNPDGRAGGDRPCQLFNGQYPGPLIYARWGDRIEVTMKNSMPQNGTGIHWHGIRQLNTVQYDGVPGITECPLAPGDTKTYKFQATQHGTTWYHSHFSNQYGEGAFGPLVIEGPASANYDVDLGPLIVNDYYYETSWRVGLQSHNNLQNRQPPPPGDTILLNGTMKNSAGGGTYFSPSQKLVAKKKYRLRLINTSADNNIRVSLDNHPFQVISSDLIPIKPYTANWILLAVGQRYDVIFTANQTAGNYWFRAEVENACASSNKFYGRGIFTYNGVEVADPTSDPKSAPPVAKPGGCSDESPLVPWVPNEVGSSADFISQADNLQVNIGIAQVATNGQNIVFWGINQTAIDVDWNKPTLQYIADGNTSYPKPFNLIEVNHQRMWSFWIIQETPGTPVPIPHPIHLHGHDFYVLGAGTGTFDLQNTPPTLKYSNPPRRDTAILPGGGWLAIAFPMDNPGAWLMHCHIAWHVSDGLAVQFLENKGSSPLGDSDWRNTCSKWNTYNANPVWPKNDSGLKKRVVGDIGSVV